MNLFSRITLKQISSCRGATFLWDCSWRHTFVEFSQLWNKNSISNLNWKNNSRSLLRMQIFPSLRMLQECLFFLSAVSDNEKLYQTPCETTPYIQGPPIPLDFFNFLAGTREGGHSSGAFDLASCVQISIEWAPSSSDGLGSLSLLPLSLLSSFVDVLSHSLPLRFRNKETGKEFEKKIKDTIQL